MPDDAPVLDALLTHARSFDRGVAAYIGGRPGYPAAAVDFLLGGARRRRVLDLGAGTGKLTEALVAAGHEVVAVEPLDGMRAALADRLPTVTALAGTAEHLPVADGDVDAVLVAQAWHWFDPVAASAEIGRVLRPGGRLGLVWNVRIEDPGWAGAFGELLASAQDVARDQSEDPQVAAPFGVPEARRFDWSDRLTRSALLDLVASRSYFLVLPPEQQQEVLARVQRLLDTHPQVVGRTVLELPYQARCFSYRRTGD